MRIDYIEDKEVETATLRVDVSVDCTHYDRVAGGLALHDRESFSIYIGSGFPWAIPYINTPHTRFRGFPHVQWGVHLCLYQSPETQWDPSRGMVGYVDQLHAWLKAAALDQLDPEEGPLHPPVAYVAASTKVYIDANTPGREMWPWRGVALYKEVKPGLIAITEWREYGEIDKATPFAPTLLLGSELSFEYPKYVATLLRSLERKGVETPRFLVYLMSAAGRIPEGQPLRMVIGTPSRGIVGDPESRKQHLTVWEISPADTETLRLAAIACDVSNQFKDGDPPEAIQKLIDAALAQLTKWRKESEVGWCSVTENRPEIIVPRDFGTDMEWFRQKRVMLWGCGALGGQVAEHLVRAGVRRLVLVDDDRVDPGILVRQNFVYDDLNDPKADALTRRLKAINPDVMVEPRRQNIITTILNAPGWANEIDLVIDATASLPVRTKLEHVQKGHERRIPIANLMISGAARHGLLGFSPAGYSGGTFDVVRRLGIAAKNRAWLADWVDAFWQRNTSEPARQPEPGCSDPTFVGSNADVSALTARMLNNLSAWLASEDDNARGMLLSQDSTKAKDEVLQFPPDMVISMGDTEVRLAHHAWRDTKGWIAAGARARSAEDETGGLMLGQYDEALGIVWVTNVSGPPSDSTFCPEGFVCGTEGTTRLCEEQKTRSLGAVQYIGTWHSHPVSAARPSRTDFEGIAALFEQNPKQGPFQFMMIVGDATATTPNIGMYRFEKTSLARIDDAAVVLIAEHGTVVDAPAVAGFRYRIGLSLSGGGSRAVAFHLGTLRALVDTGLMDAVDLVSGVSGGSVMAGIVGYSERPFVEIDDATTKFLRQGLVVPALKKLCSPKRFLPVILYWVVASLPSIAVDGLAAAVMKFGGFVGASARFKRGLRRIKWPLRRRYSRTHVMADAVADIVGNGRCDAQTRGGRAIVFNACELRTGTAFRMSNTRYGTWRYGWAPAGELRVADAVMASAAFPALLPAFDWVKSFQKDGQNRRERVLITDGGVYENMGVSVMEPGTTPHFNVIDYRPEVIVASDASAGQFADDSLPGYWAARIVRVVDAVMRKVQDATKGRLHAHAKDGRIKGFVYAHLGQIDDRVPMRPSAWISREAVMDYPTDFSAMSDANIEMLAGRGEAITRTLLTRYLLSD